jgi:succinate dehydrogenase / fumarate reductase, membrane anchor subunit
LYAHWTMRIFSLLALLSLFYHAWIGIWTVITDYIKPVALRLIIEIIVVLALICYLIWGIEILWGI